MQATPVPIAELLHKCKGHPVRTSLFDPIYRDRLGRYPGILVDVASASLIVDCLDVPVSAPAGTFVTLEIVREGQLHLCHTQMQHGFPYMPHRFLLAWPDSIQSNQLRSFPRVDTYIPVHYATADQPTPDQGVIVNISAGGAALQGRARHEPGTIVALIFALGSGLHFQDIKAEVLRTTGSRAGGWNMGLRFLDLTPEQHTALDQWVGYRSQVDVCPGK